MMASFERHLKKKNYGLSIMKDLQFEQTRKALVSKQKDLKRHEGKGNKPNAFSALCEDDIAVLYEKYLLGTSSPEALLNTLLFNNTIQFGFRGCKEHRDMTWGDVKLHKTASGEEYLKYNERQTKTCTLGGNTRDVRKVPPKIFSVPGNERDPIAVYKLFAEQRPAEMNSDDSPFYLAVNNLKKLESLSNKALLKKAPASVNKLNLIMKNMAEKAGLAKFTNHSGRKTMMQILVNQNFPSTDIIQLSGHKNLQSVSHYSTVNESQNPEISRNWKPCSHV